MTTLVTFDCLLYSDIFLCPALIGDLADGQAAVGVAVPGEAGFLMMV